MLPTNKKALIIYTLVIIAALVFVFLPDTASKEVRVITSSKDVNIEEWKTKNGIRVLYVYAPELPMVDIKVIFDAGSVRDGNKPGIAKLVNGMLSHGAKLGNKTLTVDDISERFEDIGARFSASSSKDNANISLRTLTDDKLLKKSVSTMQAIINAPSLIIKN